jgi:hypothetical protein
MPFLLGHGGDAVLPDHQHKRSRSLCQSSGGVAALLAFMGLAIIELMPIPELELGMSGMYAAAPSRFVLWLTRKAIRSGSMQASQESSHQTPGADSAGSL